MDKIQVTSAPTENNATSSQSQTTVATTSPTTDAAATLQVPAPTGPAVSFQLVPETTDSNATPPVQQTDNATTAGATATPDTPARKSSFTVLRSDESVEEVVDQDGKHRMVKVVSEKAGQRPKSFKVLRSFDAGDEDDDAETNEAENDIDDDDDDDVNVGGGGTGDYSDSELIKSGGIAIKRRKRLKKRAKSSIKQIFATESGGGGTGGGGDGAGSGSVTVLGATGPGSLHRQHSKDHDSGFEPSPRAMRSTKTTRAAYTALPERARPDVADGRTCSSRLEKRKPGDKKSVNMTTVSQSIQRNIRRYGHAIVAVCIYV